MYEYGSDFDFDGGSSDYEEGYAPPRATRDSTYAYPTGVLPTRLEVHYRAIV